MMMMINNYIYQLINLWEHFEIFLYKKKSGLEITCVSFQMWSPIFMVK